MSFTFKICQIITSITMIHQFHEIFQSNFWRFFTIWPKCGVPPYAAPCTSGQPCWLVKPRFLTRLEESVAIRLGPKSTSVLTKQLNRAAHNRFFFELKTVPAPLQFYKHTQPKILSKVLLYYREENYTIEKNKNILVCNKYENKNFRYW